MERAPPETGIVSHIPLVYFCKQKHILTLASITIKFQQQPTNKKGCLSETAYFRFMKYGEKSALLYFPTSAVFPLHEAIHFIKIGNFHCIVVPK